MIKGKYPNPLVSNVHQRDLYNSLRFGQPGNLIHLFGE